MTADPHTETDSLYDREDAVRFLREVIAAAGSEGIRKDELDKAFDAFAETFASFAMIAAWLKRGVTFRWDEADQDLALVLAEE